MKIILIKTSACTQHPQPPTLSEAGSPASAPSHQTRWQLGHSRAVKTTPVNVSLARSCWGQWIQKLFTTETKIQAQLLNGLTMASYYTDIASSGVRRRATAQVVTQRKSFWTNLCAGHTNLWSTFLVCCDSIVTWQSSYAYTTGGGNYSGGK